MEKKKKRTTRGTTTHVRDAIERDKERRTANIARARCQGHVDNDDEDDDEDDDDVL